MLLSDCDAMIHFEAIQVVVFYIFFYQQSISNPPGEMKEGHVVNFPLCFIKSLLSLNFFAATTISSFLI